MSKKDDECAGVEITPGVPADAEVIADIRRLAWLHDYANTAAGVTPDDLRAVVERRWGLASNEHETAKWLSRLARPGTRIRVAREHGRVLGFVAPVTGDNGYQCIRNLYVRPACRSRGIGGRLLNEAVRGFSRQHPVVLVVTQYNTGAIALYRRHGFRPSWRIVLGAKLPGGRRIPVMEMMLPAISVIESPDYERESHMQTAEAVYAEITRILAGIRKCNDEIRNHDAAVQEAVRRRNALDDEMLNITGGLGTDEAIHVADRLVGDALAEAVLASGIRASIREA